MEAVNVMVQPVDSYRMGKKSQVKEIHNTYVKKSTIKNFQRVYGKLAMAKSKCTAWYGRFLETIKDDGKQVAY